MDSFMNNFKGISTQLTPFAKKFEDGLGQARQYAQEKLGTAQDLTELPAEYLVLERKLDALYNTLNALLKTHGVFSTSVLPTAVTDTVYSFSKSIRESAAPVLAQSPIPISADTSDQPELTANHLLARVCMESAGIMGQDPLSQPFKKLGFAEEKLGDAMQALKDQTFEKFTNPVNRVVYSRIADATRARRNVISTRLHLDSIKSRFKAATPQKAAELQMDLEKAEDEFVDDVEESTQLMKTILNSPSTLRHLSDLIAHNIAYHKLCVQTWSELGPEIEEMQVSHQAMYSTDHDIQ